MDLEFTESGKKSAKLLEWLEFEYDHYEKSSDWFWIVGLSGLLLIVLAVIFKNFLFAIIILIGTFTVMMYAIREPELVHFQITNRGIKIKKDTYLYKDLHSFAIKDDQPPHRLMIESNRLLLPHIIIPLGETDPDEVRNILSKFLEEEPFEESITDMLSEHLGF